MHVTKISKWSVIPKENNSFFGMQWKKEKGWKYYAFG